MADEDAEKDIQLKFDGTIIRQQGGAPAEAVINALTALQRLVHLIGMQSEGRAFGQRAKPSSKVRKEFAVICRPAQTGSHVQPFDVGSLAEQAGSSIARTQLLKVLRAFDSESAETVEAEIPDARERWFMADAASGLIPSADSGIELTIRPGTKGPFSFKADRARPLIERFKSGRPPQSQSITRITALVHSINYSRSEVVLKPSGERMFRIQYPSVLAAMIHANGKKRLSIKGLPERNQAGDIVNFRKIDIIAELDGGIEPIESVRIEGKNTITTSRPVRPMVCFDYEDKVFTYNEAAIGIDVWSEDYDILRRNIIDDIRMLWRNYALAPDTELDTDALRVKRNLNNRFRAV